MAHDMDECVEGQVHLGFIKGGEYLCKLSD